MESVRSDPVCIPNKENVPPHTAVTFDVNQCSLEEPHVGNWQDLERYWGDEKHRVHQLETQLSSSLEKHLLYDDCLNQPCKHLNTSEDENSCYIEPSYVRGETVKDIPTSYELKGFHPHEFIVIGTYVDKRVIPGFKYRIRQNTTNKYLFGGKPQFLQQIGLGYGKRLTFASNCLNKNQNYFWSDNCPEGYAFSIEAITVGNKFSIVDCTTKSVVGYAVVSNIKEQSETQTAVKNGGSIEKEIRVTFTCVAGSEENLEVKYDEVAISGTAILIKEKISHFAELKSIKLDSFTFENCELWPVKVAASG